MPFTELACRPLVGSNLNAGSRNGSSTEPGGTADLTYASGGWVAATGVFTPAAGNPINDGVAVGDFASVFPDAATVGVFIGQVTARDATTITVSLTVKMGTAPILGVANTTLKIGGAWKGPNAASGFPFTLATWNSLTNTAGDTVRINLKNDASFAVTAAITVAAVAAGSKKPTMQGYTTAYGDLGKATIDGGTSGASYSVWSPSINMWHVDIIWQNNGATGNAALIATASSYLRCVAANARGAGFVSSSGNSVYIECEAYGCNQNGDASIGGFVFNSTRVAATLIRCISHDNTAANSVGFTSAMSSSPGSVTYYDCIADSNAGHGFEMTGLVMHNLINCIAYNNGGAGVKVADVAAGSALYVENTLLISNTSYGINYLSTTNPGFFMIRSCGFFGNLADTNGLNASDVIGSITLSANPFVDSANGNFALNQNTSQLFGTGLGGFTQTSGYSKTTTSFPDIGGVQQLAGASSVQYNPGMAGGMEG